jgi:hypothetical protein
VGSVERQIGFGIVAGLVVSQLNTALFDDLVNRQASFEAVGWANLVLYLLVPIVAGGLLLHYGRALPSDERRSPERALLASIVGVVVVTALLRILTPAILHRGDLIASRLPRTLADGFSFVADYCRLAPLAGLGGRYELVATVISSAVMAAAIAFGALAFERKLEPILLSTIVGAVLGFVGWYVPGGAGVRIIGALWPVLVMASIGAVLAVTDRVTSGEEPRASL